MKDKQKVNRKKIEKEGKETIKFPANLLRPVALFLQERLKKLERTKKNIENEDPFNDTERLVNNASPDADAAEQFGHARVAAIKKELNKKIIQTRKALTRIKVGKYGICENCGQMIDTDRLLIYPDATLCVKCQLERERLEKGK